MRDSGRRCLFIQLAANIILIWRSSIAMEEENDSFGRIVQFLISTPSHNIISTTLTFLGRQELSALAEVALRSQHPSQLFRVALARMFMEQYVNRVDRGVFFMFYEDQEFRNIEANTITFLSTQSYPFLLYSFNSYSRILEAFRTNIPNHPSIPSLIEQVFLQPDLPMPGLKRQTIGMFTQTPLQQHLCMLHFPDELQEPFLDQSLEQLRDALNEEIQSVINNQAFGEGGDASVNKIIKDVRYCGYKVNYSNWKTFLIPQFQIHNLIVLMLALCSQMVFTYHNILNNIQDPFMRFTEFTLRSNIYRNVVLAVEEQYAFLFNSYNQFYNTAFNPPAEHPPLNFWRPALSIWSQKMKIHHQQNMKVYNYVIAKLRENSLRQFLFVKTQKLPSFFSQLKRQMDMQTYSSEKKEMVYAENSNKIQMQAYFQNNYDMYETLAKDYIQYMVDICINQITVHWCGHSQHVIQQHPLFSAFLKNVLYETTHFYEFIREIVRQSVPKQITINIFKDVAKEDLTLGMERLFKPVIARQILGMLNGIIREEVHQMAEFSVFEEQGFNKHKMNLDFEEKDGLLVYFASKNIIPENCPQDLSFYYNVQIVDSDPPLAKDIDNQSENMENMSQYESEDQEMQQQYQ